MTDKLMSQAHSKTDCLVCPLHRSVYFLAVLIKNSMQWLKQDANAYAPLLLRLLLAYEFFEAGLEKLSGTNWFVDLAFPFPFSLLSPEVNWYLSLGIEILAPVALILGIATRFFSAALIVLTVVAIATVHWPSQWHTLAELWKGYAITDQGYGNYKLPLMYLFMLISLLFSGAGQISVDALFSGRGQPSHAGQKSIK